MLARYRCHKIVEAGLIVAIEKPEPPREGEKAASSAPPPRWVQVKGHDGKTEEVVIPLDFCARAVPEIGKSYLVRYRDGYLSHSPAAEFEDGYALAE